jgi:sterol 14-demethylase
VALPPALKGLPLLGNLLDYRRDHVGVFWRGYKTLGPIFSIRLGPQCAVVLVGPEYQRFFFAEVDNVLSLPEVYKFVIPMFGKVLNAAETEVRKSQITMLRQAFQGKKMHHYVELMVQETSIWLDTLGEEGEFELWGAFEFLSMCIAASSFMGQELRQHIDEFVPLYHDLANGMEFVLPPNLPLPRFRRRDRARQRLAEMIRPMIMARQVHPERYNDFLGVLAEVPDLNGSPMADDTIVGLALLTLFTAYISTAAQNCWTLIHLLQHPHYLARVWDEQDAVFDHSVARMSVETLSQLERLEWALKETERLQPVFSHYARYNAQPYDIGGYYVPQGWLTMVCPAVSHRLPEVFSHPDVYDPERFSPARAEDRACPYSLIGFGGGFYKCPGMHFGTNEMKVVLSLLLQRYRLVLVDPKPLPNYDIGIIRPQPPCLVRYRRRSGHSDQKVP